MTIQHISELFSLDVKQAEFLVKGLIPSAGFSLLTGKPKAGKSTLARQLALDVALGRPFLGFETKRSPVVYLGIEEKAIEVRSHFEAMGCSDSLDIPLYVQCGSVKASLKDSIKDLEVFIKDNNVGLVVIDPLILFLKVRETNEYGSVYAELEQIVELARTTEATVLGIHHAKKRDADNVADTTMGSTAFFGSADTGLFLRLDNKGVRSLESQQRYGHDLPKTVVSWHEPTRSMSLGQSVAAIDDATAESIDERMGRDLLLAIDRTPGIAQQQLFAEVRGATHKLTENLRRFIDLGFVVCSGNGSRGSPYTYSCPVFATHSFDTK